MLQYPYHKFNHNVAFLQCYGTDKDGKQLRNERGLLGVQIAKGCAGRRKAAFGSGRMYIGKVYTDKTVNAESSSYHWYFGDDGASSVLTS